ncbi:MAG: UDP-N-acetylmuramate dehydrogenase, partial [Prevotella sp.]|nr:UDP-N-acetylmuramate dehydrogenase [Prevotella sp.]
MIERSNYNLLKHNTFGLEAQCAKFVEYETADDAVAVAEMLQRSQLPLLIIGGGSNLLLTGDFNGVVVHSAIKGIEIVAEPEASEAQSDSVLLRCGSGETWDDVVAFCVEHGYYGAENLSLIPGEVGASAVQNIGAYGVEVSQIIERIEAVEIATGRKVEFAAAECNYGYRQSRFKQEWKNRYLVTYVSYRLLHSAELKLDYGNIRSELERRNIEKPTLEELRQTIIDIRNAKLPDPKKQGNAGSFFMNPVVDRETFKRLQ